MSRDNLHDEERIRIAYEMLNETPPLYDSLKLSRADTHRLWLFTRRVMMVLMGQRAAVPRHMRTMARLPRRSR